MKETVVTQLQQSLGADRVLTGEQVRERYDHIWRMNEPLEALAVVLPRSTAEVSKALSVCHQHRQAVVTHGGLTNLVGSTKTKPDEVVLSLEKMNAIEELDVQSRTMTVQAGVILETIQRKAKEEELLFPLNFGAKGSAQIGGAISTNAGGLRVFRYGMTRNLLLGLEAVLADGTVISSMKKIIKDNSAYDLKQLFVGSEGTLGVVTRAVLKLSELPASRNSAFVGFNEYEKVVAFLKYMDRGLAGTLSAYELIWRSTYEVFTSPPATTRPPLPYDYQYYVLLESMGSRQEQDRQQMQSLLEAALEQELILDAVMALSASDLQWFWTIREDVKVMVDHCNNDQHFDISLPIPLIGDMIATLTEEVLRIPEVEKCFAFGHVADGNIHLVIGKSEQNQPLIDRINDCIYQPLQAVGGSVSAEHGIGLDKKRYLHLCRTEQEIGLMKTLKRSLDPCHILNPGKVLDL